MVPEVGRIDVTRVGVRLGTPRVDARSRARGDARHHAAELVWFATRTRTFTPMPLLRSAELLVSAIGFGAGPIGGAYGALDDDTATRAVYRALEFGITLFDTSPYYGLTRS